jgi:3-methyladenine DNA glycosylase AlkC
MAEPFKNRYDERFCERFAKDLKLIIKDFDAHEFVVRIMDDEWENREYKQRIAHITTVLRKFLPADYKEAIAKILALLDYVESTQPDFSKTDDTKFGLTLAYGAVLDNYVEQYGLDDYATSVKAMEKITRFTSCEFAAHRFIAKYPGEMMQQMLIWSKHRHWGVRRLASEGCRPRLPWAAALPKLKADPTPILPVLENLKNDPSKFVRLSVANNLNDIAKDHPQTVIDLAKRWKGESQEVDRIIKHGCRTLLKQGHPAVMALFGFDPLKSIAMEHFQISSPAIKIGDSLEFRFDLLNTNSKKALIRLEYGIYYRKANGTLRKKVYKISEKEYAGNSTAHITRKHSFRVVTTRKYHPGPHRIAVIINGNEFEKHNFELTACKKPR